MDIKNIKFVKCSGLHTITYMHDKALFNVKIKCKEDHDNKVLIVYLHTKCKAEIIDILPEAIHKNLFPSYSVDKILCFCKDINGNMVTKKRGREIDEETAINDINEITILSNTSPTNINMHDGYMSATTTKFFQNDDQYTYLLKLFNINTVEDMIKFLCTDDFKKTELFSIKVYNEIMEFLFEKGRQYELYIMNIIKKRIDNTGLTFKQIMTDEIPDHMKYEEYINETCKAFANNVDIIYQGMIQTPDMLDSVDDMKLRGFPDLIVSKRAFKHLFVNCLDKLTRNYHCISTDLDLDGFLHDYIIIDIKSSTGSLNIDGMTLRNEPLLKVYKAQLAVYGHIMNTMFENKDHPTQHTGVYILPHSIKMSSSSKSNTFNYNSCNPISDKKLFVAKIDLEGSDIEHYIGLRSIYNEYKNCINVYNSVVDNQHNKDYEFPIKFLPDSQIKQLRKMAKVNMSDIATCKELLPIDISEIDCIDFDNRYMPFVRTHLGDYSEIKQWIAQQTRSIRLVRGFTQQMMQELHEKNITSYLQTEKIKKMLLDNQKQSNKTMEIPYTIINANNENYEKILYCDDIKAKRKLFKNKIMDHKTGKKMLLCLDFETIANKLVASMCKKRFDFNLNDAYQDFGTGQKVFMVGCTSFVNNNETFEPLESHQYTLDKIIHDTLTDDIDALFDSLKSLVAYYKKKYKLKYSDIGFVIWSQFEISVIKTIPHLKNDIVFDETIKAYKFFGVEIIDLMDMFTSYPVLGVKGALDYSIKSVANAYNRHKLLSDDDTWDTTIKHGLDASYYALWYYNAKLHNDDKYEYYKSHFNNIAKYNKIDCSVMANILNITYSLLNDTIKK